MKINFTTEQRAILANGILAGAAVAIGQALVLAVIAEASAIYDRAKAIKQEKRLKKLNDAVDEVEDILSKDTRVQEAKEFMS